MDLTALPEKRGRGRPRKYSQPAEEINEYKSQKRGRGRPRKYPIEDATEPKGNKQQNSSGKHQEEEPQTPDPPKRKRGRPLGSTKKTNIKEILHKSPGKSLRGRPRKSQPGEKISRVSGKVVVSPLRFSPSPNVPRATSSKSEISRKRGRPLKITNDLPNAQMTYPAANFTATISNGISENRRRRSPDSSQPHLRISFHNHRSIRNISKEEAIKEITAVYNGIPEDKFAKFHHMTITGCYRLIDTDSDFMRDDSPRNV